MNGHMSLKDHVYAYITEQINRGALLDDDKINEQGICDRLAVSRTPVREALIQLASDGYLINSPRKGFRVRPLDEKRVKELYEVIGLLDGRIARETVHLLTEKELQSMSFLIDAMESAIANQLFAKYHALQEEFHGVYAQRYSNQEMLHIMGNLKKAFMRKSFEYQKTPEGIQILRSTNEEHRQILSLLQSGKGEEVERYLSAVHWRVANAIFESWAAKSAKSAKSVKKKKRERASAKGKPKIQNKSNC